MMQWNQGWVWKFFLMALAALAAGCASPDMGPVTRQIASVETMIRQARQAKAEEYAPLELKRAQEKLAAAKQAAEEEEVERAAMLAEEAMAEARLAEAKAEADRAKDRVADEEQDVETLRDEIDRAQKVK
jgi:chromosome segregation ATPase